jgi:hypothetical protein
MYPADEPGAPDLRAIRRYLEKYRMAAPRPANDETGRPTPTASNNESVASDRQREIPQLPANDQAKYRAPQENTWRKWVVRVTTPLCLFFLACAVLSMILCRSIMPLPVGSHLLVEVALEVFPSAYPLAASHNVFLAVVIGALTIASSRGHMEIPGTPSSRTTLVSRRTARFAYGQLLCFAALVILGVRLHAMGWRPLAALAEGASFVFLLDMVAVLWVPVFRKFLIVEVDNFHDGLMNRVTCGHGRHWRRGTIVIPHDRLLDITGYASVLGACLGYRSLRLTYVSEHGKSAVIELHALGSANLVGQIEHFLKGQFRSARGGAAIETGAALQPTTVVTR